MFLLKPKNVSVEIQKKNVDTRQNIWWNKTVFDLCEKEFTHDI